MAAQEESKPKVGFDDTPFHNECVASTDNYLEMQIFGSLKPRVV